jgi:hypothetical protein
MSEDGMNLMRELKWLIGSGHRNGKIIDRRRHHKNVEHSNLEKRCVLEKKLRTEAYALCQL